MDDPYLERRLQKLEEGVDEYLRDQRLILSELKRLAKWLEILDGRFDKLDIRLATQETKAGLLGVLGGAAAIAVALFLKFLFTGTLR